MEGKQFYDQAIDGCLKFYLLSSEALRQQFYYQRYLF